MADRALTGSEISLAVSVFGMTLPYGFIRIADDLGLSNRAWTSPPLLPLGWGGNFVLHMGTIGFIQADSFAQMPTGGRVRSTFIHELVHVWQGYHDAFPMFGYVFNSLVNQCTGAFTNTNPYAFVADGRSWPEYNCEQQGNIVRDWFMAGMPTDGPLWGFIKNNIRKGDPFYTGAHVGSRLWKGQPIARDRS